MMFANRLFRPFETLIDPLNLPITPLPDKGPIRLVLHFAKMFRAVLVAVAILAIVSGSIGLAIIWMLAKIVDGVVASGASVFINENLMLLIMFALLILVIDPLITFIEQCYMSQTVETLLPSAMRWQAHKAVENQDVAFFEDLYAGQVASRIDQVTRSVQRQLLTAVERIPDFVVQFAGSLGLLLVLAWPLAIPVLFWVVANALLAFVVTPKLIDKSSKVAEASSRANGAMTDVYSNISIVKAFSAEASEGDAIRQVMRDTIDTRHREQRLEIVTVTSVHVINAIMAIAIFVISMVGLIEGFVTMGDFVAAVTILRGLFNSAFTFISLGFAISGSYGTIRDAMPVMTSKPKLLDKPDAHPFALKAGDIVLDNVSYSYQENEKQENEGDAKKPIIRNLNLHIAAGEKIGLVGRSGAGKSTVISLLLRLRDVDEGAIRFDGQDVRDVHQHSLRQEIGVISQDIFLFNRSIRENVRYGAATATDEEINRALKMANALDFVSELTDKKNRSGLDAYVGDRGVKLSGGQRQRLAIARVILKDAKILFLDEATSALDSESEDDIQQNLQQLMSDKTAVVVAHRLSTIAAMDRLVVLDEGKIVEQGTHAELIERDGLYARLWHRQSGGFISVQ